MTSRSPRRSRTAPGRRSAPRPATRPPRPPPTRRAPGCARSCCIPQGAVALGQARAGPSAGARLLEVRGSFDQALEAALELAAPRHARPRQLAQPAPARRARRPPRSRSSRSSAAPPDLLTLPVRRRRQHARLRARVRGARPACRGSSPPRRPTAPTRSHPRSGSSRPPTRRGGGGRGDRDASPTTRSSRPGATSPTLEGLFCEPSSAAGIAGTARAGSPEPGSRVVCVITGHGLKDPATVDRTAPPPVEVEPDPDAIAEAAA